MNEEIERCAFKLAEQRRGIGLIIVNTFSGRANERLGAESEVESLKTLFTNMGLDVEDFCFRDRTKREMRKILKDTSKMDRLKTDSMIAIAISSHGCEDGIWGNDETPNPFKIHEIREYFNGHECNALAMKPKLLVLNSCRGERAEEVFLPDGPASIPEPQPTTWSDFFTISSCQYGTQCRRGTKTGSIFISNLLEVYNEYWYYPFELIMPILNLKIINKCDALAETTSGAQEIIGQSCHWESSCTCILKIPHIKPDQKLPPKPQSQLAPLDDSFRLVWATCRKGIQGPNQMSTPGGVITTPDDGLIYITDSASKCIWVYSSDGEPVYQDISPKKYIQLSIGNLGLTYCWGMCIHKKFLFVSCTLALIKFSLIGGGLLAHKFHDAPISGMDVDDYESTIYACERHSCKVLLLDLDLTVLPKKLDLTHTLNATTDRLMDIKVLNDELYILVNKNEHTIQTFDKKGNHLRNLVSREHLNESLFFTINRMKKTIFAGDIITHELKAFNANGTLMYKTGCHGDKRGNLIEPAGIDLNTNGEVIIVSPNKTKFMLQCFQVPPNM